MVPGHPEGGGVWHAANWTGLKSKKKFNRDCLLQQPPILEQAAILSEPQLIKIFSCIANFVLCRHQLKNEVMKSFSGTKKLFLKRFLLESVFSDDGSKSHLLSPHFRFFLSFPFKSFLFQ